MVVIDTYSRYPEVELVTTTSARATIPKLDAIFARHGIPNNIKSDNGPTFFGDEFAAYMKSLGIEHLTSTPLWPQGNATVEAFMEPIGKVIRTALLEKHKWKQALNQFLLNYRTTPHSTTKIPPAQLLFNRVVKGKLPMLPANKYPINRHNEAKINDEKSKEQSKHYADVKRRVQESKINVGDKVIYKQNKLSKFSSTFDINPYTVVRIKGSRIVAKRGNRYLTRNSSFFKKVESKTVIDNMDNDNDDDNDDDDYVTNGNKNVNMQIPRRSSRARRPTRHFGDPVDFSLVH